MNTTKTIHERNNRDGAYRVWVERLPWEDDHVERLRDGAGAAGDTMMAALCEVALAGEYNEEIALDEAERSELATLSRADARALVEQALDDGVASLDYPRYVVMAELQGNPADVAGEFASSAAAVAACDAIAAAEQRQWEQAGIGGGA